MAHGTHDWFATAQQGLVYRVADVGELAARMGSPDVHDRRGTVFFITSFDNGLAGWSYGASGVGGSCYFVASPVKTGRGAITLETGAGSLTYASIARHLPPPPSGVWGFEYAFAPDIEMKETWVEVRNHTAGREHIYDCGYDLELGIVWVLDSSLDKQTVATPGKVYAVNSPFSILKMVFDSSNRYYSRVIFNNLVTTLTTIQGYNGPGGHDRDVEIWIYNRTRRGLNSVVAIDSLVFTSNE